MATAEQTVTLGERASRIEGGYEHLAMRADIARVETSLAEMRANLKADIARQDGQICGIKWWILSLGAAVVALSSLAKILPLGG